jgi:hypothetical protein
VRTLNGFDLRVLCFFAETKRPESMAQFERLLPALERDHPEWVKAYVKLRKAEARFEERTRELRAIANDMEP